MLLRNASPDFPESLPDKRSWGILPQSVEGASRPFPRLRAPTAQAPRERRSPLPRSPQGEVGSDRPEWSFVARLKTGAPRIGTRMDRMNGIRMNAGAEPDGQVDESENPAVICVHPVHLRLSSFSKTDGEPVRAGPPPPRRSGPRERWFPHGGSAARRGNQPGRPCAPIHGSLPGRKRRGSARG